MIAKLLSLFALAWPLAMLAQPTSGVITRTVMIESQYGRGSAFSIDVDHREYWITAKHVLTGAKHPPYGSIKTNSVALRILNPAGVGENWLPVTFAVIDPGPDIDIVGLAAPEPLLENPVPSPPAEETGVTMGADCEFLGFPFGGGWRAAWSDGRSYWMPFVKHCTVSTLTFNKPMIFVLDGINNEGFSGGPVIYGTGGAQKIFAVVSGYVPEPAEVISSVSGKPVGLNRSVKKKTSISHQTKVNVNSGFIIAYAIIPMIDAIRKNPIGPLRVANAQK